MKIKTIYTRSQVLRAVLIVIILITAAACNGKKDERPVTPPLTSPLSQPHIGYGVINVSYTRLAAAPEEDQETADQSGYLRRGSVVRVHERRLIKKGETGEYWLFVEGSDSGWLRETLVDVYENEDQARTASQSIEG